jgi:hypothetical protein
LDPVFWSVADGVVLGFELEELEVCAIARPTAIIMTTRRKTSFFMQSSMGVDARSDLFI